MNKFASNALLKLELQGSKGLIQKVKKKLIPSGEKLALEAWNESSFSNKKLNEKLVQKNFNNYLCELIDLEYKIYLKYEEECISKGVLEIAVHGELKDKYPTVNLIINETLKIINKKNTADILKLSAVVSRIRPIYKVIEQSFGQGRMTRAGSSSQIHLQKLLKLAGYSNEFEMQQILNGTVDFLFPSKKVWDIDRKRCVIISIKRTLRERYKQVFEELGITKGMTIYLLVTETFKESLRDIADNKVDKLNSQNIYIVLRDQIKFERFPRKSNVISFSEFINKELPSKRMLWTPILESMKKT